jgi:pimeloyl-ACP methyl ester carboxylesterase
MESNLPHVRSTGHGPSVILLHSSASSGRQWDTLVAMLQPRYRLHVVDLHGHGAAAAWNSAHPMRLQDELALVRPLLRAGEPVHLVGHSYGGALALKLAATAPDRVASVAVYEPVLFRLLLEYSPRDRTMTDVLVAARSIRNWHALGRADRAGQRFVDFWSGAGTWDRLAPVPQQAIAGRMGSVIGHFDALFSDTLSRAELRGLGVPILCLTGTRTRPAARRIGELLRFALPRAVHETVPEAGHMGPVTHAPAVARRIGAFLDARVANASPQTSGLLEAA